MKATLFTTALLISASVGFAQGKMQFKEKEITLKNLKANDIPTEVVYQFKNTGDQPVIVTRVSPLTSQMKATWSSSPIPPGKSSEIKVSFVSAEMPEMFNYSIMLYSNSGNREQLNLAANIVDNPAKPALLYRYDMNGVKFKSGNVSLNDVYMTQVKSDTLYFVNTRQDSVALTTNYLPSYIRFAASPAKVAPNKKGRIILTFDAPQKNDYGYSYESVILSLNGSRDYNNRLSMTANIVEDFSKLDKKQLANAPVASFDKQSINFGDIKPGEKAVCDFTLTNTGKSELHIRKTRASCGCTAVALGQNSLAPGTSTVIRATFDSANKSGHQIKSITVITNDPKNPTQNLDISGNIK